MSFISLIFDVTKFGAVGDGATDSTTFIQAAIDAAGATGQVYIPSGNYLTDSLTLIDGSNLVGDQATLLARSGSITVLVVPDSSGGLQTSRRTQITNLIIDGNGMSTVVGISQIYTTVSNANFVVDKVTVQNCVVGMKLVGTQFGTFFRCKFFNCDVGLYLSSDSSSGGGNSNSFYDLQAVQCSVGVIVDGTGYGYPTVANYFRNATLIGNGVCGLALFTTLVVLDGSANEANGWVGGTFTYGALTAKAASIYSNNASLSYINSDCAEAAITPCIIIESNSHLHIQNVSGYGRSDPFVSCTTDSDVTLGTNIKINGSIAGITNASTLNLGAGGGSLMLAPPSSYSDPAVVNESATPQLGDFGDANGTLANTIERDAVLGECRKITFNTTVSNGNLNRTLWNPVLGSSGHEIVAVNLMSDRDAKLRFNDNGNAGAQEVTLRAGVFYRAVWFRVGATAGSQNFQIQTADTSGPVVKFANWHVFSGPDTFATHAVMSRITGGAYNPNIKALRANSEDTSAPSVGTWAVGDVVWHSAPAASGNIGWVCTTAGSPGTWKSFGPISA